MRQGNDKWWQDEVSNRYPTAPVILIGGSFVNSVSNWLRETFDLQSSDLGVLPPEAFRALQGEDPYHLRDRWVGYLWGSGVNDMFEVADRFSEEGLLKQIISSLDSRRMDR